MVYLFVLKEVPHHVDDDFFQMNNILDTFMTIWKDGGLSWIAHIECIMIQIPNSIYKIISNSFTARPQYTLVSHFLVRPYTLQSALGRNWRHGLKYCDGSTLEGHSLLYPYHIHILHREHTHSALRWFYKVHTFHMAGLTPYQFPTTLTTQTRKEDIWNADKE